MKIDRRTFTKMAGAGAAAMAVAWQQASTPAAEIGEDSAEPYELLLATQGPRGIYAEQEQFERLRRAVGSMIRTQEQLRSFQLSEDEQPLTVFRRG